MSISKDRDSAEDTKDTIVLRNLGVLMTPPRVIQTLVYILQFF